MKKQKIRLYKKLNCRIKVQKKCNFLNIQFTKNFFSIFALFIKILNILLCLITYEVLIEPTFNEPTFS